MAYPPGSPASQQTPRAVDLDLAFAAAPGQGYAVDLRVTLPDSDAAITPLAAPAPAAFDQARLRGLALQPDAYGAALGEMLFASQPLRTAFAQARAVAAGRAAPLRLRLSVAPDAAELHALRWECLADPDAPGQPLAAGALVLLSRTLPSADWRPPRQRTAGPLRAVALVAAPADLPDYGLSPLDPALELAQARALFDGCELALLGGGERGSVPALLAQLHAGCDLLFVLAHGRASDTGDTCLYLEDDTGQTAPVAGAEVLARIAALADKPRLVILGCCESAGDSGGDTLAALGPQLVRAGVPAVLAMQGRIGRETLAAFLPACLQALREDGRIDRAVALARSMVRDRPDWWVPALWMRHGVERIGAAGVDDQTVAEEQTYSVAGLPNPYLGLRAFTAADRDIFAGRERIVQALVRRLTAEDGDRLLFLVGASGSGKSSLARAGLLPGLEALLESQGQAVKTRILDRPGRAPAAALARLLADTPDAPAPTLLLLVDQFEELWRQAEPDEARRALDTLLDLAAQHRRTLRIVATMRSDFLPQLAADARFEPYEQRKVMVRAMSADELADAIQRPVQVRHPGKRLEPALVERLAHDAAEDAAYLPLLQVTLEDLWRGGSLRLAAYGGLAAAIHRRAETVFAFRDYDGLQQEPRPPAEQQAMLAMLLDLVRVAPDDEQRETRWRRTRAEITGGGPAREQLVADLTAARLLRTDRETEQDGGTERTVETVDVVHEALLRGWPRLREAIEGERERLRQRERFLLALQEWRSKQRHDDYLLSGVRLAEAETLRGHGDSVFHEPEALPFCERSAQRRDQERQRQIRRTQTVVAALSALTLLALIAAAAAGWFGSVARGQQREASDNAATAVAEKERADRNAAEARRQQQAAERQLRSAEARRLAAEASNLLAQDSSSERALLLAIEAAGIDANPATRLVLQQAVAGRPYRVRTASAQAGRVWRAVFSPDGTRILAAADENTAQLWDADGRLLVSLRHPANVNSIAFSSDGSRFFTASTDGTARLWDAEGRQIATLSGHTDRVASVAFSPDSARILTASRDETVRLWGANGRPLATLSGHTGTVQEAVFSPDGRRILTASSDGTARLWDADGRPLATLSGHTDVVASAVWRPDGARILTASSDGTARLWDAEGRQIATLSGHAGALVGAVWSPDGARILTASSDGTARLWDAEGRALATLSGHTASLTSAIFSPDGLRILTASIDTTARLWDASGRPLATLSGHADIVWSAVFSPDGERILTSAADGVARLWESEGGPPTILAGHSSALSGAEWSPDGARILTASSDGTARLWDSDSKPVTLSGHLSGLTSAAWSPDGARILTASSDGTARLWDTGGRPLATLSDSMGVVWEALWSPDGARILTVSSDEAARLWDSRGRLLTVLSGRTNAVGGAVWSPDGTRILTASGDGRIGLWDAEGRPLAVLSGDIKASVGSAVWSPDGARILTASSDGTVHLWDLEGRPVATLSGHTDFVTGEVWSPDGARILTASWDGTARLWDAEGRPLATLSGHTDALTSAAWSPNGTRILTASSDRTARLWDTEGRPLAIFSGHTDVVASAAWSPDGAHILTASWDGTARLWPTELSGWLLAARCRAGRTLTEQEIRDYQVPAPLHFDAAGLAQRQCPPASSWK